MGVAFEVFEPGRVVVRIEPALRVQNHLGGLHAVGMAMAVETATGVVTGLALPAGRLPLLRSLGLDYVARCEGALTVDARLTDGQQEAMASTSSGRVDVPFTATDEAGGTPVEGTAVWAWVTPERSTA